VTAEPQVGVVMCTRCKREHKVSVRKDTRLGIVRYDFPPGWFIEYRGYDPNPVFLCNECGAEPLAAED